MTHKLNDLWWIPDDKEVWTLATQSSAELPNGCINFLVQKTQKMVAYQREKCLPASNALNTPEDLVFLHDVNQATILACTRSRFNEHKIYTNMGQVLMSVNPFEKIPGLYGKNVIDEFKNPDTKSFAAHVYSIPARAYTNMCMTGGNQSILISGESGAGKTEATKQCLSFLTVVADVQQASTKSSGNDTAPPVNISEIANRIIAASPILEAFGNAQTIRNPNSSRFGKWMVLNFDKNNVINSSTVVSYLLEKSRVTQRDIKERNYHIFYQLLRGAETEQLVKWGLEQQTFKYKYLVQEPNKEAADLDDAKIFQETLGALLKMGFSQQEAMDTFKVVGAVLLLGNVNFISTHNGEGSDIGNTDVIDTVATLLSVSPGILGYAMCNRSIESGKTRKSLISIQLNVQKAVETRDSLAKALYDKIFQEIIVMINANSRSSNSVGPQDTDRCIGLLDIFGFEIFVENSFEQLCINYCNEMLQNQFNFVIFTAEKNLYASEGIRCDTIEFKDNIDTIREIETVFKSLDEEGRIPRGTSKTWFDKLKRGAKMPNISFPNRKTGDVFVVRHYAGDVDYLAAGFLEKNVESINNDLVGAMASSADPVINRIFAPAPVVADAHPSSATAKIEAKSGGGGGGAAARKSSTSSALSGKTISWKFTSQLHQLMTMLKQTESHFIRCVKSNEACHAGVFDSNLVHKQLIYSGVFEVVKIQQSGLPCRLSHPEFLSRYKCLSHSRVRYTFKTPTELIQSLKMVNGLDLPLAQMGATRTFFKGSEQRVLELKRDEMYKAATVRIQCWVMRINRSALFQRVIRQYRAFWAFDAQLQLQAAQESFAEITAVSQSYLKLTRMDVLQHIVATLGEHLELIEQRVVLIADAHVQFALDTEEGVLSLDTIISRAIDLDMTHHSIVTDCKAKVQRYFRALEFASHVESAQAMSNLSLVMIQEGIDNMRQFSDIIPAAVEVVRRAVEHKSVVDSEIENILVPMHEALQRACLRFEWNTGELVEVEPSQGDDDPSSLVAFVVHYSDIEFNCKDVHLLFIDCCNFLRLKNEFVPANEAIGALDFINLCRPTSQTMVEQLGEFRKWADIQCSGTGLRMLLETGWIPRTDLGSEREVEFAHLEVLLNRLKTVKNPSEAVGEVLQAGTWMVMLRMAFKERKWEQLEQIVLDADEDGVATGTFDEYPQCIDELNNAQWQVIYHGLTADMLFVMGQSVFGAISLDSDNWGDLVKELGENLLLSDTVKSFAQPEASPKLLALLPLLENLLQLRSLMYKHDISLSKSIHAAFMDTHGENIKTHGLTERITEELRICGLLIQKTEFEAALDASTAEGVAMAYSHEGLNDQPSYHSLCDLTKSADGVRKALASLDALSSSYNVVLFDKILLAREVLKGRDLLCRGEEETGLDWESVSKDFHHSVFEATRDLDNAIPVEAAMREFGTIQAEMTRRVLLAHLRAVLGKVCVQGAVDVDVLVREDELVDLFHKFNDCTHLISANLASIPSNIKTLASFTSCVLKIRKHVLEHCWEASLKLLLEKAASMDHGAGLLVPGVKDELEKVRGELRAREAFHLLKKELESVTLTIPDGELDSAAVVDLEPLKAAILGVRPNQGKHSKKLLSLAELVISVLESLLSGKSSAIDQEKIDDVAAQYNAFHLNALSIEKVFKYIKVHNFLKILTETMRKFHTAERLVEGVNDVRSSIKSLPPKFIPWLKAAYVYCELLGAFESQDWIRIVESTRSLEDCIAVLSTVKITSEGEGKHEAAFVAILREKKVAGYKTALAIKADQEKQRSEEEVSGLSPEESLKLQLRRQDELNPYGIGELRAAGYDDKAVLNIKPPIKFLWAYDFDLVLLRKAGYQAGSLLANNFRVAELYFAGFSVDRLKAAGCSVPDLRAAGVTFDQLRLAGFKEAEILSGGLPVDFLKVVEYDASKLVKMGLATKDLVAAGFSALELRAAGFSALELKNSGMKDPRRLYEAGYDMVKLKAAFDIGELKSAGFTFEMLRRSDFTDKCLFDAGFEFELERDALMALFEATRGMQWKVRLHWGTSRPVSEWYGVQTELDERDRDRVVGLQLCDNNLCGSLPEKLWMLSRLKSVQLSMNRLQGSVPALVVKRLQTNNVQADLSNNPSLLPISPSKLSQQHGPSSPAPRNPLQRDTSMTSLSAPSTPAAASVNMNLFGSTGRYSGAVPLTPAGTSLAENNSTPAIPNEHEDIERAALMDLFHAASGSRWIRRTHWGTNRPIGEWFGVTQNKAGRVSRLCLASNNLHGSVPDSISYLEALRELDLRLNQLMGPVPSSLGNIKHLQKIHLQTNKLSCAIPDSLGQLAHLTVLDLRSNQLTDAVPQSLNRLTKLQYLGLRSNKLLAASTKEAIANIPWCKVVV